MAIHRARRMPVELRVDFTEDLRWIELARDQKIRLPLWRMPITTGGMRKYLKKLDIQVEDYLSDNNEKTLRHFGNMNPDWPLRAWVGLQLEWLSWRDREPFTEEPIIVEKRRRGRPKKVVADIV